ncbi:MAG: NfeD family protein [Verrucomicrobia bacterium]|nr:NfeD family protein [Verrucomicrobiota bacterium]
MMPYLLLLLGLIFTWLEFYLPGGAFATFGALAILGALVSYFSQSESLIGSVIFFFVACTALIVVIRLAISRIRKSAAANTFFLSKDQEGYKAADFASGMIGKRGITMTEFGPSGYVLIDGKRYPAICRGPYLDKGREVEVIAGESGHFIVKPC